MKKQIRNFIVLSSLTTASIYAINKFISISSTMKNLLSTDHGTFFNWKYGKIFYTKSGKGSPVLLVHDLNPASSGTEWEKLYKSLSKNHTVYTIDLLGCGRSDKPNLTYTNYLYVQLLTDFVKEVIRKKTNIVSTGAACSFTVMACHMNPEHFDRLLLINPEKLGNLVKTPSKRMNALKYFIELPIFGTFIYNILYSNIGIQKLFTEEYFHEKNPVSSKVMDTYYESAHLDSSKGKYLLSSIESYYTNINIVHALEKMNNRIYLLCSRENDASGEIAATYTDCNFSIETAYIENSRYLPQLEAPEKLLQKLELFLASE